LLSAGLLLFAGLWLLPADAHARETRYEINFDKPTREWREGPIRYIITKDEDKTYKSLKTDQQRANFIDLFWRRRDPTPKTEYNEFKEQFRRRALDADRLYSETTTPGWKTDMGKIYILVGPPDELVRDRVGRSHRGTVIWIYRKPPFPDLPPNTVIAFAKNVQGEYVLTSKPTFDADVAHGIKLAGDRATDPDFGLPLIAGADPLMLAQGVPLSQGEFETAFIYTRMQQLPPKEAEILHDVIVTRQAFDVFPFKSRYSFFRTSSENTLVVATLAIKTTSVQYRSVGGQERPEVLVYGKLVDQDDSGNEIPLSALSGFAPAPGNEKAGIDDYLLFQAVFPAKPGRYLAVFAAEDRVAQKIGTFREPLIIPDIAQGEGIRLSSITLAKRVSSRPAAASPEAAATPPAAGTAPPAPGAGSEPPATGQTPAPPGSPGVAPGPVFPQFVFGALEVVQAAEPLFRPKDTMSFYFQVYGVQKDPESGQPSLDIDYDFFAIQPDGEVTLGNIHVGPTPSQAQAYALPLDRFPPAEYRLRVTVTDRLAGTKASEDLAFSIIP
jgi:GWxTD domain-containing protein